MRGTLGHGFDNKRIVYTDDLIAHYGRVAICYVQLRRENKLKRDIKSCMGKLIELFSKTTETDCILR